LERSKLPKTLSQAAQFSICHIPIGPMSFLSELNLLTGVGSLKKGALTLFIAIIEKGKKSSKFQQK